MSFVSDYPEQRYVVPVTRLRRDCFLPDESFGDVLVKEGDRVDSNTVIARGKVPAQHHIIDIRAGLGLRANAPISELVQVTPGDIVFVGQILAGKSIQRGRRVASPIDGEVMAVDKGRIVVKELAAEVELEAGLRGVVRRVKPGRGATIETIGAVIQGVWGNNRRAVGTLWMEPDGGIETIVADTLDSKWEGAIIVTRYPLEQTGLVALEELRAGGVIAPSMDSTLIEASRFSRRAILLTEGFGDLSVSPIVQQQLEELQGKSAILDAVLPTSLMARRPEVVVNVITTQADRPKELRQVSRLRAGMEVRLSREPYAGQVGVIRNLPAAPIQLEGSGLRVLVAEVGFEGGDTVTIPVANLEVFAG